MLNPCAIADEQMSCNIELIMDGIERALRELPPEFTEPMSRSANRIAILRGRLLIGAVDLHSEGMNPQIAHVHIVSTLALHPSAPLDACIVGIGDNHQAALADAGSTWWPTVGAQIFTLLHSRHFGATDHFDGTEEWAVSNFHGVAGPVFTRGSEDWNFDALSTAPVFAFAAPLLGGRPIHSVKAVLTGDGSTWSLSTEIDGHGKSRVVSPWISAIKPPPTPVICARYAICVPRTWRDPSPDDGFIVRLLRGLFR